MERRGAKTPTQKALRFAGVAALCLLAGVPAAPAQEGGLPGLLQKLFGAPPAAKPPEPAPTPRRTHKASSDFLPAATTRAPGAPGGAPAQASFHVETLGDSLAVLGAEGLSEAFADKPEIGVVGRARDASGLVRADYFDWPRFAAKRPPPTSPISSSSCSASTTANRCATAPRRSTR